jgi:dynein heavy chain
MKTNQKINKFRKDYRPVALRGPVIYFIIQEMIMIDQMYQVSLDLFLGKLFESKKIQRKIISQKENLKYYQNINIYMLVIYTSR